MSEKNAKKKNGMNPSTYRLLGSWGGGLNDGYRLPGDASTRKSFPLRLIAIILLWLYIFFSYFMRRCDCHNLV